LIGLMTGAAAMGASNFACQLAPIAGMFVIGRVIDVTGSFATVFWIMAAGPLVGTAVLMAIRPPKVA